MLGSQDVSECQGVEERNKLLASMLTHVPLEERQKRTNTGRFHIVQSTHLLGTSRPLQKLKPYCIILYHGGGQSSSSLFQKDGVLKDDLLKDCPT